MQLIRRLLCLTALCLPSVSMAQSDAVPALGLELNTADTVEGSCRLTFVLNNTLDADIDQFVAETVLFTKDGGVLLLTLFDFADLPMGRPRVRQFQVPGHSCADLGQVLVNGVDTCQIANAASDRCQGALSLSNRTDIELKG